MNLVRLMALGCLVFPLALQGCGGAKSVSKIDDTPIDIEGRQRRGYTAEGRGSSPGAHGQYHGHCMEDRTLAAFTDDTGKVTYCDAAFYETSELQAAGFNMEIKAEAARADRWIIEGGVVRNRAELELAASRQTIVNAHRLNLTKGVVQWQIDIYNKWAESAHLPPWGKVSAGSHHAEEHNAPEQLGLHAQTDRNSYTPGEPIHLRCRIENGAKASVLLHPILSDDVQVYLKHEGQQKEVSLGSRLMDLHWIRKEEIIKLLPAKSVSFDRSIIKEWYFDYPKTVGRYELYVVYRNGRKHLGGLELWTGELKSNILEFEIR